MNFIKKWFEWFCLYLDKGPLIKGVVLVNSFRRDTNDCTIRSLMTVKGYSYRTARRKAEKKGRKRKDGMYLSSFCQLTKTEGCRHVQIYDKNLAYHVIYRFKSYEFCSTKTLSEFAKTTRNGNFLILIPGHALVLKDGIFYGNGDERSREPVRLVFEF